MNFSKHTPLILLLIIGCASAPITPKTTNPCPAPGVSMTEWRQLTAEGVTFMAPADFKWATTGEVIKWQDDEGNVIGMIFGSTADDLSNARQVPGSSVCHEGIAEQSALLLSNYGAGSYYAAAYWETFATDNDTLPLVVFSQSRTRQAQARALQMLRTVRPLKQ